jgi:hypothetical protein
VDTDRLLVILGAGASFDLYANIDPSLAPPVSKDLFSTRYDNLMLDLAPELGKAVVEIRRGQSKGRSVEECLEDIQQRVEGYPELGRRLLAVQYYL